MHVDNSLMRYEVHLNVYARFLVISQNLQQEISFVMTCVSVCKNWDPT